MGPNDTRGFLGGAIGVIGGAIGGALTGGIPGAIMGGARALSGGGGRGAAGGGAVTYTKMPLKKQKARRGGRILLAGNGEEQRGCPPGFKRTADGGCEPKGVEIGGYGVDPGAILPGGEPFIYPIEEEYGDAVMGRYGPALEPARRETVTRVCPPGAVLGKDGFCYNRGSITNAQRWWPRGRRPLLTGGEMRCISVAARAAGKLQRKQKQLQELGLLKKPVRRRSRALPAGHHAHAHHD